MATSFAVEPCGRDTPELFLRPQAVDGVRARGQAWRPQRSLLNSQGFPQTVHTAHRRAAHLVPKLSTGCVWCGGSVGPSVGPRPDGGGQHVAEGVSDPSDVLPAQGRPEVREECCVSIAELDVSSYSGPQRRARRPGATPGRPRRAERASAACCCPRTPSPTASRSLKSNDFYRPAHELIYDAILDLYGRGEPADAITVSDELTKRGDLSRVGGQAYLHQLIASVPDGGQRRLLRPDRRRAGRAAPAGRRRHPHRPDGLRPGRRRRRGHRQRRAGRDLPGGRQARRRGLPHPRRRARGHGRRDRARVRVAAATWSACPPASPTSTPSPTACTPAR